MPKNRIYSNGIMIELNAAVKKNKSIKNKNIIL